MSVIHADGKTRYIYNHEDSLCCGEVCTVLDRGCGDITLNFDNPRLMPIFISFGDAHGRLTPVEQQPLSRFVEVTTTIRPTAKWSVGDKCWVCNDAGHGISDDSHDSIGDDLTMVILALYTTPDGTENAVVAHNGVGAHRCFRVDMLREHVSKRDKAIDRAIEASKCKKCEFVPSVHRKVCAKLYDAGLLKDD